jgi:hypothetical protein
MTRSLTRWTTIPALGLTVLSLTQLGSARVEERLTYTKTQSYQSALRYLRVDHGYKVLEKDPESGYLLFEYPKREEGFTHGSIEVVEREATIALVVQLPQMPTYHERMLIEGLLKKLRDDYGSPPVRKVPEKPAKDSDEGPADKVPPDASPPVTDEDDSKPESPPSKKS